MRFPAALILLATTLTACGGSNDSAGPGETYSGTYTLRTIDRQSLPYLHFQAEGTTVEVVADTLVITDNGSGGSFTKKLAIRVTASGQVRSQLLFDVGVYTRNGAAATFQVDSPGGGCLFCGSDGTTVGTIGGGKVTVSDREGIPYAYQK
jgi:hypothetical protein